MRIHVFFAEVMDNRLDKSLGVVARQRGLLPDRHDGTVSFVAPYFHNITEFE